MERYRIEVCGCDGHEIVNHLRHPVDENGEWVRYKDHAACIKELESALVGAKSDLTGLKIELCTARRERDLAKQSFDRQSGTTSDLIRQLAAAQDREEKYRCVLELGVSSLQYSDCHDMDEWMAGVRSFLHELPEPYQEPNNA